MKRSENNEKPVTAPSPAGGRTSFWALNGVMFQGALSDNLFKLLMFMMVIKLAHLEFPWNDALAAGRAGLYQTIVEAAFILPFILVVSVAGWLSDRFSKTHVTRATKVMEAAVMALATITLALDSVWLTVAVLFIMGLQSALFSPSKYGILPEILPPQKVAWGNGILQGFTFLAIIVGTIAGPWLFGRYEENLWIPGLLLTILACAGIGLSMRMRPLAPADPGQRFSMNPLAMLKRYGREILTRPGLKWSVFGMILFWMVAMMLQGTAVLASKEILGLDPGGTGIALLPVVLGLGIGCLITGLISRHRIELGLVPFGALAMCITCILLYHSTPGLEAVKTLSPGALARLRIDLPLLMGISGLMCGFFIVPLESFVVQSTDPAIRGGVWAVSNVLVAIGMVAGACLRGAIIMATASPGAVFLAGGLLMLLASCVIGIRFPMIPLRFLICVIFRSFYRTRVRGLENIPAKGGALIAANHQSYLDGVLISAIVDRPVRFIMSEEMYRKWYIRPFARLTRSIPISEGQSVRSMLQALREAREEIRRGGLVAIFPEGQITRTGMLLPFRRGLRRIMKDLEEPIIPVAIDGAAESGLGLLGGRMRMRLRSPWPRRPLNVAVGEPLSSGSSSTELRQGIMDLMVDAFAFRKEDAALLHREAIRSLRRRPLQRDFLEPGCDKSLSRAGLLAAIVALGGKLKERWATEERIGILLPPSIAAAAVNVAAAAAGKVTVNLNYTLSREMLRSISEQCGLRLIITSKVFLDQAGLALPEGPAAVYLEEVKDRITKLDRFKALLRGWFQPIRSLERRLGRGRIARMDDTATMIFSSGSTGMPKGVPLTHWNLWANIEGACRQIRLREGARMLGALPFFHAFGIMANLWMPLMKGMGIAFCPNPVDGPTVGHLAERHRLTHLLATPTFLSIYTRRVPPAQFGSIEFVLTGAEKLRSCVAEAFERRFGLKPVEGYGCTECAPVVTMSTADHRSPGIFQQGSRKGSIGHPVPGVSIRIRDLETGEDLGPGRPGMMLVKGHNVMQGYFQRPDASEEALRDGWYVTGDVAQMDEDGFVTITDRLSRFSKIGGEMVPHVKVEEALQDAMRIEDIAFAVTGVPDESRGERLAVLHTLQNGAARIAAERLQKSGLPRLWIPKPSDFVRVEEIPVLGTGKLDLRKIRALAAEALSREASMEGVEALAS